MQDNQKLKKLSHNFIFLQIWRQIALKECSCHDICFKKYKTIKSRKSFLITCFFGKYSASLNENILGCAIGIVCFYCACRFFFQSHKKAKCFYCPRALIIEKKFNLVFSNVWLLTEFRYRPMFISARTTTPTRG